MGGTESHFLPDSRGGISYLRDSDVEALLPPSFWPSQCSDSVERRGLRPPTSAARPELTRKSDAVKVVQATLNLI